jgi:subtilisin family serine protease
MSVALLFSLNAFSKSTCDSQVIGKNKVKTCIDGAVKTIERFHRDSETAISSRETYLEGKLQSVEGYSSSGRLTMRSSYEHLEDGSYIFSQYYGDELRQKQRRRGFGPEEILLESYGLHGRTGELESIDVHEGEIVTMRRVYENNKHTFTYKFIYDGDRVIGFDAFDLEGKLIGDYLQNKIGTLPSGRVNSAVKIAIIDSGFDHQHEDLIDHILVNQEDPIDGVDNDGDGLIDNYLGSFYDEDGNLEFSRFGTRFINGSDWGGSQWSPVEYGIPFETISVRNSGVIDSHGTHVASLALRDLEDTSLIPFAGDYGDSKYLDKISNKLKNEKVDFVNMSFSFPHFATGDLPRATLMSLEKLIKNNPETVFFVAAGNDGREFTGGRFNCLYPACYKHENVVTVGSTDDSEWRNDEKYKMADFSNYGESFVDVFAPGRKVNGALLGDMSVRYSGTSMASPMALNIASKLKELFPSKSAIEIKDAIFKGSLKVDGVDAKYGVISFENSIQYLENN